jgi:signal transduction histidine kinase
MGDQHEVAFDYLRQIISVPSVGNPNITYSFVAYPTQALYNSYMTYTPIYGMAIVVTLCLVVVAVCLLYVAVTIEQEKIRHEELVRTEAEAQFTSFLAHEVRNPLSGIDSCTTLMLEGDRGRAKQLKHKVDAQHGLSVDDVRRLFEETEQLIQDGEHIQKCVKYIQSILNNTLDLVKLKDGRLDIHLKNVLLGAEVVDMALMMLTSVKSPEVALHVDCSQAVFVVADPLRVTQVLVNLLTNSFKFCRAGDVRVIVKHFPETGLVHIAVEDTGPGIPPEHRNKLFSKYGQIAVRQGTGLGLCLAQVPTCAD